FFQAEDGIRDLTVTGVQTCALPISTLVIEYFGFTIAPHLDCPVIHLLGRQSIDACGVDSFEKLFLAFRAPARPHAMIEVIKAHRSEERRVGKDCRARGWPEH